MTNAHHQRGQILLEQGRHADAERELRQALAIEPESAELHLKLGLACMGQERWRDAMHEAERVIALEPDTHHGFTLKGHSLLRLDQAAKARECLKQGLVHDPENAHIHGLLAATFSAQKRWKEARESAHAGLQLDPEDQDCLNQLALANTQLGDHAAAEEGLAAALQQDPDNALTHANRGWSLLRQARYREAMDAYREALRLDPTLEHARSGLIEAIKGQNPAYALFLRYFLFLTRLRPGVMLAIMIGTVLLRQLLMEVAEQVPAIAIPVMIVFWGLVAFIISSWIAIPLFNATLLLHPLGRHAISRGERIQSLGLLAILAAAAAAAVIWLTGSLAAGIAAMFILALSIPMKADQLQDDALLVPWFYRILRNAIADLHRQRAGQGHQTGPDITEVAVPPADVESICQCLLGLLDDLPAEQAQALRLVDLGAVEPEDAAGRLGITTNLLKVRRHRGRQALRGLLEATCRSCADHGCVDCHCPAPEGPGGGG